MYYFSRTKLTETKRLQDNLALYLAVVVVVDGLNFENLSESCLS